MSMPAVKITPGHVDSDWRNRVTAKDFQSGKYNIAKNTDGSTNWSQVLAYYGCAADHTRN